MVLKRPPARRRLSIWVFAPLVAPFAILIGIGVFAAVAPYDSTKTPPPGTHGSLVWGDAIFANQIEMKAWLKLHGASYGPWAKLHPAALSLVKPRPKRHRAVVAVKRKTPKARHVVVAAPVAVASQRDQGSAPWLFIALGSVLAAAAVATPKRIFARVGVTAAGRDREVRLAVAGVGVAVLAGAAAAFFLG